MPILTRKGVAVLSVIIGLGACTRLPPSQVAEVDPAPSAPPVASAPSASSEPTEPSEPKTSTEQSFATAIETLVTQLFALFAEDARRLDQAVARLCHHVGDEAHSSGLGSRPEHADREAPVTRASALIAAQSAWRATALSWARAAVLATGPSLTDNRQTRINAWPVRAGLVSRQTLALTRLATEASTDELRRQVSQGSAAVQGLPALELLLFSDLPKALGPAQTRVSEGDAATPAAVPATTRTPEVAACRVTAEIAGHLARTADSLLSDWRHWAVLRDAMTSLQAAAPYAATLSPPQAESADADPAPDARTAAFRTLQDRLLNGLLGHIRHLSRDTVGSLYAYSNDPSRLTVLEYAWSRTSMAALKAGLDAVYSTLSPATGLLIDLAAHPASAAAGSRDPMADLQVTLQATTEAAAALPDPIENHPLAPADIAALQALSLQLERLHRLMETQVIPALGLTVDFNSADGD